MGIFMNLKKMRILSMFLILVFLCFNGAYADPQDRSEHNKGLVRLTKPDKDENIFGHSYTICGVTNKTDVRVRLSRYNESSRNYLDFKDTNGESSWIIGKSGIFMKKVELPEKFNRIQIVFTKDDESQYEVYTINVLEESFNDTIKNGLDELWYLY